MFKRLFRIVLWEPSSVGGYRRLLFFSSVVLGCVLGVVASFAVVWHGEVQVVGDVLCGYVFDGSFVRVVNHTIVCELSDVDWLDLTLPIVYGSGGFG